MARSASFALFAFALTFVAVPAEVLAQDTLDTAERAGEHDLETDPALIREATGACHDVEPARAAAVEIGHLRVWVWAESPSGVFADWNATLTCSP